MSLHQLELFPVQSAVPRCSLCRSRSFNFACVRCDTRRNNLRPLTPAERQVLQQQLAFFREQAALAEAEREAYLSRLRALARPVRLTLVGCGRKKRGVASQARELYTSTLFRTSLRYAEAFADEVFILSALHGLVAPGVVLKPYDFRLTELRQREREAWGFRIARGLADQLHALPVRVTFLAGGEYARWIAPRLPSSWEVEQPLEGLGLGPRLRWLKQAVAAGTRVPSLQK